MSRGDELGRQDEQGRGTYELGSEQIIISIIITITIIIKDEIHHISLTMIIIKHCQS